METEPLMLTILAMGLWAVVLAEYGENRGTSSMVCDGLRFFAGVAATVLIGLLILL